MPAFATWTVVRFLGKERKRPLMRNTRDIYQLLPRQLSATLHSTASMQCNFICSDGNSFC